MPLWCCDCPFLALAALTPLSLAGDGLVCSWIPLLSPLFCEQACRCLSLGLFTRVAIPASGLLSQVSSFRLPFGHSGLVLTLSNAAHTSLPSACLLIADAGVCAAFPLGVAIRHVICGFYLFIYLFIFPPGYASEIPRFPTDPLVRVFPGVWKLLF